jgi:hypothetical protein
MFLILILVVLNTLGIVYILLKIDLILKRLGIESRTRSEGLNLPVVNGSLCGSARASKLTTGCTVYMNGSSGCVGYGNIQCVSGVCEPLGEVSLYGHNQAYNIGDIKEIVSYPLAE